MPWLRAASRSSSIEMPSSISATRAGGLTDVSSASMSPLPMLVVASSDLRRATTHVTRVAVLTRLRQVDVSTTITHRGCPGVQRLQSRCSAASWHRRTAPVVSSARPQNPTTYRLFTTLLDAAEVTAVDLAAAYAQRWEIELAFDELMTHQRSPRTVLRSKSPDLVRQEIWGHLCCHYAGLNQLLPNRLRLGVRTYRGAAHRGREDVALPSVATGWTTHSGAASIWVSHAVDDEPAGPGGFAMRVPADDPRAGRRTA
ncbi:MAG: transposase [Jiangellaceae bacterium]